MKSLPFVMMVAAVISSPAVAAPPTIIDFDDQPGFGQQFGPLVYPSVSFTNGASGRVYIDESPLGNKTLSSWNARGDATDPLDFVFTRPVRNLSFFVGADDVDFSTLNVRIFRTGFPTFIDVAFPNFGDGNGGTFRPIDLEPFGRISQITVSSTDPLGVSFDLVTFNVVPEPASWAMMIAGFGLVGAMARRRHMAQVAPAAV